jgi:asparagine synthase (glutamine-hydrolysing)
MCGIAGILSGDVGDIERRESITRQMLSKIVHRGPDGEGVFSRGRYTLGHRRLAIIDLEGGAQPMQSACGRYVLSFNGEIYNYRELRRRLINRGVAFRTQSDTEVLLQMLIHEGEEALHALNGMFAFVFADLQEDRWFLARDPFGIKPLYFSQTKQGLVFASEIKALLAHPAIAGELNWSTMQQYLTFQFGLDEQTLFRGIQKVAPGSFMKGHGDRCERMARYWETTYRIDSDHTEDYFKNDLRTLLDDSVRLQLRSDVPVGTYLSGGLDSSLVTMLAAGHSSGPIKTFNGKFDEGPEYDESHYARIVSDASNSEMYSVTPTAEDFIEDLPKLIYALDEPMGGPGLFPQYRVSKLAAGHVKVMLGGQGGDELFGGYARYLLGYLEQALKGAIMQTQEESQHVVTLASIIPNLPLLDQYRPLMQSFWKDGLFGDMDRRYFQLVDRSQQIETLLTDDALAAINREEVFEQFQSIFHRPDTRSYLNKMMHFDLKTLLPALLQIEDRVSMAVSLESRVPLLDCRIVDLVNSIPPQMKFHGGKTKHILTETVCDIVPKPVLQRKDKMGFPVPLHKWFRQSPVRDFVRDVLMGSACRQRGLFRPEAIETLLDGEQPFGRQLWGALCLELWHQQFLDGMSYSGIEPTKHTGPPPTLRLAS